MWDCGRETASIKLMKLYDAEIMFMSEEMFEVFYDFLPHSPYPTYPIATSNQLAMATKKCTVSLKNDMDFIL